LSGLYLNRLFCKYGITALRERLIDFNQIVEMKLWEFLYWLLTKKGLTALRKKLITLEEVSFMASPAQLQQRLNHLIPD